MRPISFAAGLWTGVLALGTACATQALGAEFEVRTAPHQQRAVILLTGKIVKGDVGRLQRALREARRSRPAMPPLLALDSLGGILEEGVAVARAVKREGLPTAVMPGAVCASACTAIFFGGFDRTTGRPDRTAYGAARIGVHNWRYGMMVHGWDVTLRTSAAKADDFKRKIDTFHEEMRVSQGIRERLEQTSADLMYFLTWRDMEGSEIARRLAFDELAQLAAPDRKWPCGLSCLLRVNVPYADVTWPQTTLAAIGVEDGSRVLPAATYLETWPTLFGRSVRTVCTLWHTLERDFVCATSRKDGRVGYLLIRRSQPERPAAAALRALCAADRPVEACRMEITGLVRMTPAGPVIHSAHARPLPASPAEPARPAVASAATN